MNLNNDENAIDFSQIKPIPIVGGFLRGAHHPHCERYYNHLLWFRGHPLCLGCTCIYSGMLLGLALVFIINWTSVSLVMWILSHLIALVPTIVQPWFQWKPYKIMARLILGISISTYWVSGMLLMNPPFSVWIFRFWVLMIFIILYYGLRAIRNRYTYNPCDDCPLGVFPTCDWNLPRLLNENADIDLLETINETMFGNSTSD